MSKAKNKKLKVGLGCLIVFAVFFVLSAMVAGLIDDEVSPKQNIVKLLKDQSQKAVLRSVDFKELDQSKDGKTIKVYEYVNGAQWVLVGQKIYTLNGLAKQITPNIPYKYDVENVESQQEPTQVQEYDGFKVGQATWLDVRSFYKDKDSILNGSEWLYNTYGDYKFYVILKERKVAFVFYKNPNGTTQGEEAKLEVILTNFTKF